MASQKTTVKWGWTESSGSCTRDKTMVRRLSAQDISQMQIYATKTRTVE